MAFAVSASPTARILSPPDDHFSDSELQILENDPNLIVVRLQDVPENAGDGDAVSALTTERDGLKARVSELEATVLQLNQMATRLSSSLPVQTAPSRSWRRYVMH